MRTYIFRALTVFWAVSVWAQTDSPLPRVAQPAVVATGEAVVYAKPDLARIHVGVTTQAATAQAASSQNAVQSQAVLERVRSLLGPKADIRTSGYSLSPNYQYPKPGGQPIIAGYTANNTVEVSTEDLAGVGKLIDAVSQAGATNIRQLEFTLKDEKAARTEALRLAALDARSNAAAMAAALGAKIGKVLGLQQSGAAPIQPMMRMAMAADMAASTPIQEGRIEVRAAVTLTLALE